LCGSIENVEKKDVERILKKELGLSDEAWRLLWRARWVKNEMKRAEKSENRKFLTVT
jgi:phage terminase small subunit